MVHRTTLETPGSLKTSSKGPGLGSSNLRSESIWLESEILRFLVFSADFGVPRARSVGGLRRRPMHHLSSRVVARTMVHSTLDETPASLRTRTPKMAENAPCTIPLRAFFGRFSGSRSLRCGGLIKRAVHHLSTRDAGRKMLHRTPSETPYTSSTRYPKMAVFDQIAFLAQPPI